MQLLFKLVNDVVRDYDANTNVPSFISIKKQSDKFAICLHSKNKINKMLKKNEVKKPTQAKKIFIQ